MVAAVWSTAPTEAGDYPARYLFTFLQNHGMLAVTGSPVWYTVTGGSARYVERAAKSLTAVQTSTPIRAVTPRRRAASRSATTPTRSSTSTASCVATHPHQALRHARRADARPSASVLGAIGYTVNPTAAAHRHVGAAAAPRAQASWNYALPVVRRRCRPRCRSATT